MSDKVTYRAIIEHDTSEGDVKGKEVVEFSIEELVDSIMKAGDGWYINHAHKCFPPYKDGDFKKVESVTDIVKSTVQIKRLNEEEKNGY